MIRRWRALAAGLMIAVLAAGPAAAHRGHATLAVVAIDAETNAVAVTLRMAAHDVEPVLANIAPDAQPSLDDPDALKILIDYAQRNFRIAGVTLAFAGQTLAGDTVELRFAGRLAGRPAELSISGALFGETHSDHTTQVNVRRAGITRTVQFGADDAARSVPLPGF